MSHKILQLGYEYRTTGTYQFTVTDEQDVMFRKYMARRIGEDALPTLENHSTDAFPLDISMDDIEGDVAAGISGVIHQDVLIIDMLWVEDDLRGDGIGTRLVQMAEDIARKRGSICARVRVTDCVPFFVGLGYKITGTVQDVPKNVVSLFGNAPSRRAVYWLTKEF